MIFYFEKQQRTSYLSNLFQQQKDMKNTIISLSIISLNILKKKLQFETLLNYQFVAILKLTQYEFPLFLMKLLVIKKKKKVPHISHDPSGHGQYQMKLTYGYQQLFCFVLVQSYYSLVLPSDCKTCSMSSLNN